MTAAVDPDLAASVRPVPDVPVHRVDFSRPVVSILGLPFDAIGLDEAVRRIREAAFAGRRFFVSTPNLNFAISARSDAVFRGSLLRSDMCLADGMPLVWIARLLRLPVHERVSGADVFAALQAHGGAPLRVYLFGGPPGAAKRAAEAINCVDGGVRCVGFDAAGFGSIDSMSDPALIARINASGAHFVVVSLGAKKGQSWIEHNAGRLHAPVLSHLGAVMNFAAGTVKRAPLWMQRGGLEWLWRIKEEPALWRRYGGDGLRAIRLLLGSVVPDAIASRMGVARAGDPTVDFERSAHRTTIRLRGDWRRSDVAALGAALDRCVEIGAPVTIDLANSPALGAAVVALLLLARGWFDEHGGIEFVGAPAGLRRQLRNQLATNALLGAD
jgi:N-acetylglucosaminyldiphosphoundecaprenol N-acetyl-beta-D-mannosaminyltransferase